MSRKLAIRGHPTRGKEVIEILKMLGGKNNCGSPADNLGLCYSVDNEFDICAHYFGYDDYEDVELTIFTLEEFLKKYPFKVGDKVVYMDDNDIVVISEIKWDNTVGDIFYNVKRIDEDEFFLCPPELLKLYKETNMEESKDCPKAPILSNRYDYAEGKCGYVIPAGYEFDCIKEGFQTEIILKPKKPKYPKTFKECRAILNYMVGSMSGYKASLLASLQDLLVCRDAYWKIAGDELGLGKPWKPDWTSGYPVYCISVSVNKIGKGKWYTDNKILAFPTEEIRDVFYENFKDLIERCKELL